MLGVFEHYIPKFNTFNKQKQLEIILNGYDKGNAEFFTINVSLKYAVQNFTWIHVHVHPLSSSSIPPLSLHWLKMASYSILSLVIVLFSFTYANLKIQVNLQIFVTFYLFSLNLSKFKNIFYLAKPG